MPSRCEYCTLNYGDASHCVPLPDLSPHNFHAFVKEELATAGVRDVINREIQVEAVGMNLPNLLGPTFVLRPGSYRVRLLEQPGNLQKQQWNPVFSLVDWDKLGYWAADSIVPSSLKLQLHKDSENLIEHIERRNQYIVDHQPLEAAFYKHFSTTKAQVSFGVSTGATQTSQSAQQTFLHELCDRQLMLRVRDFAPGMELLLRTDKSGGGLLGYLCDRGYVERLALQEFEGFVNMQKPQLVLVLDLDQTIVHTPFEPLEQRALASYQDRGRVFDVALKGQTQPCMFCAPRAYLVQFFCKLYYKCHVMYCTAGSQQYGNDVISNLRAFMLGTPDLDDHQREWIMSITDPRRLVSSRALMDPNCPRHRHFKSLGMLLKMAYVPEYAEQIVIILDDQPQVWKHPSDQKLVTMFPVPQQHLVTSDSSVRPWLKACSDMLTRLYSKVFAEGRPTKTLPEVLANVATELMQQGLRTGGH